MDQFKLETNKNQYLIILNNVSQAAFTELQTQYQTQVADGSASSSHLDSYQLWHKVVGTKKQRVYGLGSEASSASPEFSSRRREADPETAEELEELRRILQAERDAARQREEALRQQMETVRLEQERRLQEQERRLEEQERRAQEQERRAQEQDERFRQFEELLSRTVLQPTPGSSGGSRATPGSSGGSQPAPQRSDVLRPTPGTAEVTQPAPGPSVVPSSRPPLQLDMDQIFRPTSSSARRTSSVRSGRGKSIR